MKQLSVAELKKWTEDNRYFLLVDVREQWERAAYNIGGQHIPLGEIISRKEEISKGAPVVVYCEKGMRSAIAIQRLEPLGFDNLYNLEGGLSLMRKLC
jgi:adenylyltransferase/sulfurtransferase